MDQKHQQDLEYTHSVLNYLNATYQGRFASLNVLQQLGYQGFAIAEIERTRSVLEKVRRWTSELWQQVCLLSPSWTQPETFEAQSALQFAEAIRVELLQVAEECQAFLNDAATPQKPQQVKFLIASYARFAYSRDNYIKGFIEFAKVFGQPTMLHYYTSLQPTATEDIETVAAMLNAYKDPSQPAHNFFGALFHECVRLPGVFRTHVHDLLQLLAPFQGGFSFERAGIVAVEALDWQNASFGPVQAGYWRAYNFSPEEASRWVKAGFESAAVAFDWKLFSILPEVASQWAQRGAPAAVAVEWLRAGYTVEAAADLIARGIKEPPK